MEFALDYIYVFGVKYGTYNERRKYFWYVGNYLMAVNTSHSYIPYKDSQLLV